MNRTSCLLLTGCFLVLASSAQPFTRSDFSRPDTLYRLDKSLGEISGLTILPDGNLGAVQDEKGFIYTLDPDNGDILGRHRFASDGDFEAVEVVGDRIFVLRSDGRLYIAALEGASMDDREDWPSHRSRRLLHRGCDAEALTYDMHTATLWTACKELPGSGLKRVRSFYQIGEQSDEFTSARVFSTSGRSKDESGFRLKRSQFKPSAMAFLPGGIHLLVLSTVRPALLLLDRSGVVLNTWKLPSGVLPQPEGISIHPDGRLFIASEGPGERGTLAVYRLDL